MPFLLGLLAVAVIITITAKATSKEAPPVSKDKPLPTPPLPAGFKPFKGVVTPEISAWASTILHSPSTYPMFSIVRRDNLAARVEHHTWTYREGVRVTGNFRGVTLYQVT